MINRTMRAGFFFDNPVSYHLVSEVATRNSLELVGVYCGAFEAELVPGGKLYSFAEELLVQVDLAVVFMGRETYYDLSTKALRRGKQLFLAMLPEYDVNTLTELNSIAAEIGINPGFGCSGEQLIRPEWIGSNHFFLQILRDFPSHSPVALLPGLMVYDIASCIRLKLTGLKKFKAVGVPLFSREPLTVHLSLEYDNGSMITATWTSAAEDRKGLLRFFSSDYNTQVELDACSPLLGPQKQIAIEKLLVETNYSKGFYEYLQCLEAGKKPPFGLDHALETLHLVNSIFDRLAPAQT